MSSTAATPAEPVLSSDVATLQQMVRDLLAEVARLRQENQQLQARLDQALQGRFGPRSERRPQARTPATQVDATDPVAGHGRQQLPTHLPRREIVHDLTEAERLCPCCAQVRACIGTQTSEQLDFEPARFFVVVHVRRTYACKRCDGPTEQRYTTAGPATAGPLPKGLAGPGLLAHLVVSKYQDHLPLHRLELIVGRSGLKLARSTLCDWMAGCAGLLTPLVTLMRQRILQSRVLHSDDTPVPFLVPGQTKTSRGHLWVYLGDRERPYAVFDFTPTYSRDGPENFLKSYRGYLQADCLSQYEGLYQGGQVSHVACWAHARRKFVDAQREDEALAAEALAQIGQLYGIERQLKEKYGPLDDAGRAAYRQEHARPVLAALKGWLETQQKVALPRSQLGQAVRYALVHWEALARYTEAGYLAIDNNSAERALRSVAIGRKNWLFCGSEEGGQTAAVLYSVMGSCKAVDINPQRYLAEALVGLAALGEDPGAEELAGWLPDCWQRRTTQGTERPTTED